MKPLALGAAVGLVVAGAVAGYFYLNNNGLTEAELETARTLSLTTLPVLPADPSNAVADNPAAIRLGKALFSEVGLSSNGEVACVTCHLEERQFQDDLPLSKGVGTTDRRAMPLRGVGYALWLFWDGRKDSLWAQAIGPLESAVEHGFTRSQVADFIAANYNEPYEALFGPLPMLPQTQAASPLGDEAQQAAWAALSPEQQDQINRVFSNTGKALAAFQRTLMPLENRFDRFVAAQIIGEQPDENAALTPQEIQGFKIFAGKGECVNCHNGPRLTDEFFHNTGVSSPQDAVTDFGRLVAIEQVQNDEFNCLGPYSDADPAQCGTLRFMSTNEHLFERAYKSPSLRGVAGRPPYMHAGQIATLALVVEHYNRAMPSVSGHSELAPLGLSTAEKAALVAFLKTL